MWRPALNHALFSKQQPRRNKQIGRRRAARDRRIVKDRETRKRDKVGIVDLRGHRVRKKDDDIDRVVGNSSRNLLVPTPCAALHALDVERRESCP